MGGCSLTMTRVELMVAATAAALAGCAADPSAEPQPPVELDARGGWETRLGQTVTLDGIAEPRKLGAFLDAKPAGIWIDGVQDWPDSMVGKRVQVTGRVIERSDLPVFVEPPPGAPIPQGIPVPAGTDLDRAAHRLLLAGATWKLAE